MDKRIILTKVTINFENSDFDITINRNGDIKLYGQVFIFNTITGEEIGNIRKEFKDIVTSKYKELYEV